MQCKHCPVCAATRRCTKIRHVCQFMQREALKDIKPARWKLAGRK